MFPALENAFDSAKVIFFQCPFLWVGGAVVMSKEEEFFISGGL